MHSFIDKQLLHVMCILSCVHRKPERCISKVNNENKNMFVTCAPVSFRVLLRVLESERKRFPLSDAR